MLSTKTIRSLRLLLLAVAGVFALPHSAQAVPSFARQTGLNCIVCHTEFPILTDFGRQFKLGGYTLSNGESKLPPIAIMLQPSFTATSRGIAGGAAPHFSDNSNFALNQASVFYNGRLFGPYAETLFGKTAATFLNKFGTFIQGTYDGAAGRVGWDNAELRYADTMTLGGAPVSYGFYLNNNPTMGDLWNSTPVWSYPFSGSGLAPAPGASTLVDGGLSQQVLGLGAYAMISNSFYVDIAAYHTLGTSFQKAMGVAPEGETQVPGLAPYWRLAYTKSAGNKSFEVGAFGLIADTYPGRDKTAGKDHYADWGVDSEFQTSFGKHDITALLSCIYEKQDTNASMRLGGATNGSDHLLSLKGNVNYLYDKTIGGGAGYFHTDGSHDSLLHSDSAAGSPMNDGFVLQLNYLPFNKNSGPAFWPKSNVKFSAQYVIYNKFNGARHNYDGSGANASDNNTLYLEAWIAF